MFKASFFLLFGLSICGIFACGGSTENGKSISTGENPKNVTDSLPEDGFDAGLKFESKDYHAEKCFDGTEEEEASCASIDVSYLSVSLNDPAVAKKINDAIFEAVTEKKAQATTMNKWVNEIKKITSLDEVVQTEITCSRIIQTNEILVIGIMNYSYAYMAAHPNSFSTYLNFDLRTGKVLTLDDLLRPGYKKHLLRAAENCFITENGNQAWDFTPRKGDFALSEDFAITSEGLLFPYDAYEIGPYAAGAPNALVPYTQIAGYIPEGSPLQAFMKPDKRK